ncbi:MAG: response regulator transcription factor [Chloroflexi bacterium]|nr:response regulator transcription factor [Chloroflexota bacterium]
MVQPNAQPNGHNKARVLVVEDDADTGQLVRLRLEKAGYQVFGATDGLTGLREFFKQQPDLVILDILMPQMDGWEVCRRLRQVSDVPIIILTARGQESDEVRGLALGADDYISKPFGNQELIARVQAALRRAQMPAVGKNNQIYSDGIITIDYGRREVYVHGEPVELTPLEYRMLTSLIDYPEQVLTHEQLLDKVWGMDNSSSESVKICVNHLRRKIETDPANPELIVTVRGVGYRYRRPTSLAPTKNVRAPRLSLYPR